MKQITFIIPLINLLLFYNATHSTALDNRFNKKTIPASSSPFPGRSKTPNQNIIDNKKIKKTKTVSKNDLVSLDFDNADIRVILKFMSELTNKNFIINEKVRGKVTILSPKKINAADAYKVLESILEVHGLAAVETDNIVKIVPVSEGKSRAIETKIGKNKEDINKDDRLVTQLIPLDFANANEIKGALAPLISKSSNIIAYLPTNTLILTDISSNISRLAGIIKELDVESLEFIITVIPVKFATSDDLSSMILSIIQASTTSSLKGRSKRVSGKRGLGKKGIKIVSDSRTNYLIVVASPHDTKRIKSLIEKLDIDIPKPDSEIHVYFLENAVAEEMAQVLSGQTAQIANQRKKKQGVKRGKRQSYSKSANKDSITITPDKATNSLVIAASKEDYNAIIGVIEKLDIPRSQVLVEAVLMEVNLTNSFEIGTELRTMDDPTAGGIRTFAGTSLPPNTINDVVKAIAQGSIPAANGLIFGLSKGKNLGLLMRAMGANSDVNILSTPSILTMDNQEAEIIIGQERPFLTRQQSDSTGLSIISTFDFKDVGITLRITPHITRGKYVRLELFQEIKDFVEENPEVVGAVTTTKRQAKTTVVVENNETVVIGGLISDTKAKGLTQVPCIGNIPLLGWLFKSFNTNSRKTNLMIFITPHIVNSPEDMKKLSTKKKLDLENNITEQLKQRKSKNINEKIKLLIK